MNLRRFLTLDWEAIAGIIAAVAAIVMHLLHLIDEGVLATIAVVLIALLFIGDLRRDRATEQAHATIGDIRTVLQSIQTDLLPPTRYLSGRPSYASPANASPEMQREK